MSRRVYYGICILSTKMTFTNMFLGAPGSGKGTISNWVVRDFALKHVSSGDLLRQHMNNGTPLGKEAKEFINKGQAHNMFSRFSESMKFSLFCFSMYMVEVFY